jgi:D-alanyl-D-alanine carboxypeptidase (penicillin-binding protein 5/6)
MIVPGHMRGHLPWPATGQGAVAVLGSGLVARSPREREVPIASLTKMMTALLVLRDHPLGVNQQGPSITVSPADVSLYQSERAAGDSVMQVVAGERLSEYQALEALLIPSADNVAALLAEWDAGSTGAFVAKMNAEAKHLGLTRTVYAGVSGADPATVSTVTDQLIVAADCMADPVFRQIVAKPQATLPLAGVVYNVNSLLGTDGIIGVKTGWVPAGGASFVFAAKRTSPIGPVTVLGAVFGQKSATPLASAFAAARNLIAAVPSVVRRVSVISSGTVVGHIDSAYATPVPLVTAGSASLVAWPGATYDLAFHASGTISAPLAAGTKVGELVATFGTRHVSVPVVTAKALPTASLSWKLKRF